MSAVGEAWASADQPLSLAGTWRFSLDRDDAGVAHEWFRRELADSIELPGILQAQGFGDEIGVETPWVLSLYDRHWYLRDEYKAWTKPGHVRVPFLCQPPRHYLGPAWYQRDVDVPAAWDGKRLVLSLERPHWGTTAWVDDQKIGSCDSLCVAHVFDLGTWPPGTHRLTVRIDNRMLMPYRSDAHSVSDSLGSSWNGIVGRIDLSATDLVWIEDAQVFPKIENKSAVIRVEIGNHSGSPGEGTISAGKVTEPIHWDVHGGQAELVVPLGDSAELWDEFHPALQHIELHLQAGTAHDRRELKFGLRELRTEGSEFIFNGRKTQFRGTHFGGDFPLTGYPPTDVDSWEKIIRICQAWGLNHIRFHSWCPPEAAFTAADKLGFYFQVECGMWNEFRSGAPMEKMLYAETDRIIKAYGNHPSFMLLSPSNEPKGRWQECLTKWVAHYREHDTRRLYAVGTGCSLAVEPGPVTEADYVDAPHIGPNMLRGKSGWFGLDYSRSLRGVDVPVVAHELGQWCAFPDFDAIPKFTGYLQPGNYEIFRDSLNAHGLAEKAAQFTAASGRFQLACYKEEIEANLRTPGMGGFQLLDLHDYMGQGTALVGLLDPFWESKGYAAAAEFRRFCNRTVPLARLPKRTFSSDEQFHAPLEISHYGAAPIVDAAPQWRIEDTQGQVVASGTLPKLTIPIGKSTPLGSVAADLAKLAAPASYKLTVSIAGTDSENDWKFWVYTVQTEAGTPTDVVVTQSWADAERELAKGGKVLFLPKAAELDWTSPPLDDVPIFWNRQMNPAWGRMLGLCCDPRHPALAAFPTDSHCDWQWTSIVRKARAINLDRLPRDLQPIVQPIDDWNRNYKLALAFECRVGDGRLFVCSIDLATPDDSRPAARQLRRSLLEYMGGQQFRPQVSVSADQIRGILFDTQIMQELGAEASGGDGAANAVDGNPNTFWSSGSNRQPGSKYPHVLLMLFPHDVEMRGIVCLPRQNSRDREGDICQYVVEAGDGQSWREVARGELASAFEPQEIRFQETLRVQQLRFTAISGFGDDNMASLAELAVIQTPAAVDAYQRPLRRTAIAPANNSRRIEIGE